MPIPPTRSRRKLEKIGCGEKIPIVSFRRSINQEDCFPLIELIVLLSAPMEVIMKRLEARSPDGYANTYQERQKVSGLISTIEPLLRDCADHEIDTTRPVDATVDEILRVT
jgi:shikimate kinase